MFQSNSKIKTAFFYENNFRAAYISIPKKKKKEKKKEKRTKF